jgi:hypothetical protein
MVVERVRGIPVGGGMFRPVSEISLSAKASAEYILLAYCFNFDRANPGPHAQFSVGEPPSPEVRRLFEALNHAPAELRTIQAVQAALWVIAGDVRKEELQGRFPVDETHIAAARQLLERAGIETKTKRLFQ